MRSSFLVALAPLLALSSPAPAAEGVVEEALGTYQHCELGCITVELRPDFTFTYQLHGHLDNMLVEGSWEFIAPNLVRANSNPPSGALPPVAGFGAPGRTTVVAVNADDNPLPGVTFEFVCGTQHHSAITNASGVAALPVCSETSFSLSAFLDGFRTVTFALAAGPHNSFRVVLQNEELELSDELWLLHDGRLYILNDGLTRTVGPERERSPNPRDAPDANRASRGRRR